MSNLIQHILNKEFDSARTALDETMENIIEHKLAEMKRGIDLTEGVGNYSLKKVKRYKNPEKMSDEEIWDNDGNDESYTKYHITKDGKTIGRLRRHDYFGGTYARINGKTTELKKGKSGSGPLSKLHSYVKSKKGKLEETELTEVSKKTAFKAYAGSSDPDADDEKNVTRANRLKGHIERKWGDKAGNDADNHAYAKHFGRGNIWQKDDPLTASRYGKTNIRGKKSLAKEKLAGLKAQKKLPLPEETELTEGRYKGIRNKKKGASLAAQTRDLRHTFGVAPGKTRRAGPRASLEEDIRNFVRNMKAAGKAAAHDLSSTGTIGKEFGPAAKVAGNAIKNVAGKVGKKIAKYNDDHPNFGMVTSDKRINEGKLKNWAIDFEEKHGRKATNADLAKKPNLPTYGGKKTLRNNVFRKPSDRDVEDRLKKEISDAQDKEDKIMREDTLSEMKGKGFLDKGIFASKKRKELSKRLDKKMDDEQIKSLGHKFGGEPFNKKDYDNDTEKLIKNKKYMRMSMIGSKVKYPEMFKK